MADKFVAASKIYEAIAELNAPETKQAIRMALVACDRDWLFDQPKPTVTERTPANGSKPAQTETPSRVR